MRQLSSQPNIDLSASYRGWSLRFALLLILTGIVAGLAGGALMRLLYAVEHVSWHYRTGNLLEAASRASTRRHILVLLLAGIIIGAGGKLFHRLLGKPAEVNAAIWFRSGKMPVLATLAQAVHSIVIVGMGTSLGRESPIKQAGGALASRIAQWGRLSPAEQRLLVACGVGAGMAAAYNVPVGGALFAVEILIGSMSMRMVLPALTCSGIAIVASWLLLPTGSIYDVPEYPLSAQLTVWSILVGPLLGLAAVPMVRFIGWADARKPRNIRSMIVAPILMLTALGALSILFPQLLGNGKDTVQLAYMDKLSISLLLALPALKLLATTGCLASGASGGLFTPAMTIGALLGGLFGHAWNIIWPGASMGSCAVIGSCAFLAAATQGPVSALVLVLELTRHIDATMVPMLLAVAGAMLVMRAIESRSVYSVRLHLEQATPRPGDLPESPRLGRTISHEYQSVSAAIGYPQVAQIFLAGSGHAQEPIYVIDDKGRLTGAITVEVASHANSGRTPLEALKAEDICVPLEPLTTAMTEEQIADRLCSARDCALPIIDADSGKLLGVVNKEEKKRGRS